MNDVVITDELKQFLNSNKELIATEDWINVVAEGYYQLMGKDLKSLFTMLEQLGVDDVQEQYNDILLTEVIPEKLEMMKDGLANQFDIDLETFIKLTLGMNDCNTIYGFEYLAKLMLNNQTRLGIAIDTDGSKYYEEWSFKYV